MAGPPTHVVMVKRKDSKAPATVAGAAWINEKGWLGVRLNPCTILTDRDDIYINIYPNRELDEPLPEEPPGWLEPLPE